MKRGDRVYDRWWPWRLGEVIKAGRSVTVRWSGGGVERYDAAHVTFLRKEPKR